MDVKNAIMRSGVIREIVPITLRQSVKMTKQAENIEEGHLFGVII